MKVTTFTRRALATRRFKRKMERAGYRYRETDWEIVRGARIGDVIVDVKIDIDGRGVWTLIGAKSN